MSKLGVISDIHGNYPALQAVFEKLCSEDCSRIICLGDVAGYYSMINECIELLRKENIFSLKGNHDSYLLGESFCPRSRSVAECISYQQKIISEENLEWIRQLKPKAITDGYYAVHGGFENALDEYIQEFDFEKASQIAPHIKIFLSGHSHIPAIQKKEEVLYCNPGSVGQPRDYDCRASYAIYESGNIKFGRVAYDIDQIAYSMNKAGFDNYYYKNLYHGCKIGELR